ncbi:transposable element protein, putative [Candida dubliniensis CD36]|uniref:Transposable element protein, putative n=1 Tax=Candida dubliniensis (strain CD36 / ATCC MYA-646 / CBS 7987 / NCPF 3949 / NRRL Y-17841) TaxID=573826 RepID=B9WL67_CANDC|nr:transposable element protein, putative [Candida dubliniensis CD36]CAX39772.1 transposable element protein, putative [Candida dubliniensis CD36]
MMIQIGIKQHLKRGFTTTNWLSWCWLKDIFITPPPSSSPPQSKRKNKSRKSHAYNGWTIKPATNSMEFKETYEKNNFIPLYICHLILRICCTTTLDFGIFDPNEISIRNKIVKIWPGARIIMDRPIRQRLFISEISRIKETKQKKKKKKKKVNQGENN